MRRSGAGDTRDTSDQSDTVDAVSAAMAAVPREGFLPPDQQPFAHEDAPLPIGHGSTNSQPSTVAAMLRLLGVPPGASVLDVGSGSGWTTAILAELVGPGGRVLGTELVPDLVARATEAVARLYEGRADEAGPATTGSEAGSAAAGSVEFRVAEPGVRGAPDAAPFDRILVSAMARRLPDDLLAQLAPGGVMVVPVDGEMVRVELDARGAARTSTHGGYRFVPLR